MRHAKAREFATWEWNKGEVKRRKEEAKSLQRADS